MYAHNCWKLLSAAALILFTTTLSSQTIANEQQPADSAPVQSGVVLHVNADLALVDVVVTDKGKAVHDLDKSKFHLYEDGREQPLRAFDEHKPTATSAVLAVPPQLPPHTFGNTPLYPQTGVFNVLLLDGLNTPQTDQMRARQQMIEYMGKIEPGTMMAVFTLTSRLRMVTGFTTDVAELTRTVKGQKAETPSMLAGATAPDSMDQLHELLQPGGPAAGAMAAFEADVATQVQEERVRITLAAMKQLGLYLSAVPGRKNLIWFTGSLPAALDPFGSLASSAQEMAGYTDEVRRVNDLLTAARVAVYPVDARGLMTLQPFSASNRGPGVSNIGPSLAAFSTQLADEQTAMRQIAEQTGGQAYLNNNDLKGAVASVVENGESYYTIAYTPAAKKFDGSFHKIKVSLDAPGCELAYRRGYYADAAGKSTVLPKGVISPFMASTMHGAPQATQVLFQARVLPASDPQFAGSRLMEGPAGDLTAKLKGPVHRYIVNLTIDAHTLAFTKTSAGSQQAAVDCVLVGYNAEGKQLNYVAGGIPVEVNANQYTEILTRGIPVQLAIDLPAGQQYLRIAIHDTTTDKAGALEVPLTVAAK